MDLDKLKKRHREETDELSKQLQTYMRKLDEYENKRNELEDEIAQKTEEL